MKIAVIGLGYVGLANAVLLAQKHEVRGADLNQSKVDLINQGVSPIKDAEIADFLANRQLHLEATTENPQAMEGAETIVIATPTNYDEIANQFDTSSVDATIAQAQEINPEAIIVIKSTIPIGYTAVQHQKYPQAKIVFSPEFLREGKALYDNLHPSRIVVSGHEESARLFGKLLQEGAEEKDVPVLFTNTNEAEAIKLFSNTYLAMRVAFFNELDSYALSHGFNSRQIIDGVGLDPRIGGHYNNPSFGYGGYCLPKDTKELRANFEGVPQNLISAIVDSNDTRIAYLAEHVARKGYRAVGIYKIAMKSGSDNHRASATLKLAHKIADHGINVIIFDPHLSGEEIDGFPIAQNWEKFTSRVEAIVTNRLDPDMPATTQPVLTRVIFSRD